MRALLVVLLVGTASAQDQGFEVKVPDKLDAVVGEPATLPITIAVDRGLVISKDAPVILDVAASGGVSTRKPRLGRPDAVDPEADAPRFAVTLKISGPGEHVVKVRLRMWLCGGRSCRPLDVRRTTVVVANEPKAPAQSP